MSVSKRLQEHEQGVALFSDDLVDCDKQTEAIKYDSVGLQGETHAKDQQMERCENTINDLRELYVDHAKKIQGYTI